MYSGVLLRPCLRLVTGHNPVSVLMLISKDKDPGPKAGAVNPARERIKCRGKAVG
jgi:hypothetical protein